MRDIKLTDHVIGRNEAGRWIEGYVLRLEPVYAPGGGLVRQDAYLLNSDYPNEVKIDLASDCRIIAHDVFAHTALLRDRGFEKTGEEWAHKQHPFPDVRRIVFSQTAEGPVSPDMRSIVEAMKGLALTAKRAP